MSSICVNCPQLLPGDFSLGATMGNFFKKTCDYFDVNSQTVSVTSQDSRQRDMFSELFDIYHECKEDNWDEEGAKAISRAAFIDAIKFIEIYPNYLPLPEVVPTMSGAFDFEWDSEEARCNVELTGDGNIVYAGYFSENDRDYGTKPFKSYIPEALLDIIKRVIDE